MKVAIVYDHVNKMGGAERILLALHALYPEAPLYTAVADRAKATWAKDFKIITSFIQKLPFAASTHELYPGLPIFAFESFNFSDYEVVISVTSAEAKGIITGTNTLHICYCLTPTRFLWSHYHLYFKNKLLKFISLPLITWLRVWDQVAAARPDNYIAISTEVARRIKKYYQKSAGLIYPPVDTNTFVPSVHSKNEYYLVASRLVDYKRIDLAIEACNTLKKPLKIVGEGSAYRRLKRISGPTVEFVGFLTEDMLIQYYQGCKALLFPGEEDFGIAMVEALACGKPVIAYGRGGALEIVNPGKTGELFYTQTATALGEAIQKFEKKQYNTALCRKMAERFSVARFQDEFLQHVAKSWQQHAENRSL